jgi:hypothetical protein
MINDHDTSRSLFNGRDDARMTRDRDMFDDSSLVFN